ncbi:response regulator transcription factor [Ktedonosporobacter rubrisoli]|uniref:Response regulator transcription factor n=1 Tax=Ktedonosporobacter rubrisoli TaxID=2509675 RepID=A0A4P6JRL6_KTERU|nr:response regulator transcription factor [Ktedonosporobacter rubrisoli]QBD78127.1 response regulator transcription factor [Ktedonosporobacter rubrisoli]
MENKIKVVLVDDHHIVRRGLHSFLKAFDDLAVVGEASSGEEALQHIEEWLPDVVVMDLLMPGGIDGIEAIRRIHRLLPNTRIVALTSYTDDARVLAALRAGAIGYVRKEADPDVLLASVRAAARGQSLLDPAVASAVMQELMRNGKHVNELTEREQEVLRQLAFGRTNPEIAAALVVSEETVKTHVGNILTKLQLAHRTQAVIYALKKGMISLDEIELP